MVFAYSDYYADFRWCPSCQAYVHFLASLSEAYCVECGGLLRCFRSPGLIDEAAQVKEATSSAEAGRTPGEETGSGSHLPRSA